MTRRWSITAADPAAAIQPLVAARAASRFVSRLVSRLVSSQAAAPPGIFYPHGAARVLIIALDRFSRPVLTHPWVGAVQVTARGARIVP